MIELILPSYPTKIQTAKARRAKYKKGADGEFAVGDDGKKIITNSRTVGTPRYVAINAQKMYSGFRSEHQRRQIVDGLKEYYKPYVKKMKPFTKFPLKIDISFHTTITMNFDLDNMSWIYVKTLFDSLRDHKLIPDDNVNYICEYTVRIIKIDDFEKRRIIIKFK